MNPALDIVLPVFGIVLAGYLAARVRLMDAAANQGLFRYVFYVAIPLLLFRTMATTTLPAAIPWTFWLAYYLGAFATFAAAGLTMRLAFGARLDRQGIAGFAAAYSNCVLLGIPLVLAAWGEAALLPLFAVIALQSPLFFPAAVMLIEIGQGHREELRRIPLQVLTGLARNPVILALALGLLANLAGLRLPGPADDIVAAVGGTAGPCALVSLGISLAGYRLRGGLRETAVLVAFKSLVHPAAVWLLTGPVFGIDPAWRAVAVLLAALPTGVNVYLFARHYQVAEEVIAKTTLLSTLVSVVTVSVLLAATL